MSSDDIDFVSGIYDAVLDPRGLRAFTDLLMTDLRGSSAILKELRTGPVVEAVTTSNISRRVLGDYMAHYHTVDVLLRAALRKGVDAGTTRNPELIPTREYQNTEFYCDFARPADTTQVLGGLVRVDRSRLAAIIVNRGVGEPGFTDAECQRHRRYLAPITSALRLRHRLGGAAGAGFAALEALAFGAIVCDGDGRVIFANAAAEALAAPGSGLLLGRCHDGVAAALPGDAGRLARLVRDAAETARGGAMALTAPKGGRLFLLVTPLPRAFGEVSQRVLITMRAAAPSSLADPATLAALFALTPAEARVAAALSAGGAAGEIAAELGVGVATVRTHVKRLLAKAGVASQREFSAMLGRLPPVRSDAGGAEA